MFLGLKEPDSLVRDLDPDLDLDPDPSIYLSSKNLDLYSFVASL
jgi:hypothetical protein